jgi:FkbM family methyltransferase
MSLIVSTPRNAAVISRYGSYPQRLNVLDQRQTAVQRQLRRGGLAGYEPTTQAVLLSLMEKAPPGAAFFDIGAHIGLYSALVETILGNRGCRIIAFEPTPTTAAIGRSMRHENGLTFELVELALSDEPGTATLYVSAKAETSNSLNPDHRDHAGEFTVEVSTVDRFTAAGGVDPAVIKIDVETNEPNVLAGAYETIARARPAIVCEILNATTPRLQPHIEALFGLGYHAYLLTNDLPWKAMQFEDIERLSKAGTRDWVFLPEPLTDALTRSVSGWLDAIVACDETTNLLVTADGQLPGDWNANHPAPWHRSIRDRFSTRRRR